MQNVKQIFESPEFRKYLENKAEHTRKIRKERENNIKGLYIRLDQILQSV
jgi:hypothetical protein